MTFVYVTVKRKILLQTYTDCYGKQISWIPGMVAHAIVVLACKQFVLLCFVYLGLYSFNSFNITLSWSAIMLLDSVLINFICNCIYVCMSLLLCMSMYTWAYAFMLLDSVLINFICNCVLCMHEFAFMYDYVYMSLCFILMAMHACFVLFFFALWCHVICACKVILYLYVLFM